MLQHRHIQRTRRSIPGARHPKVLRRHFFARLARTKAHSSSLALATALGVWLGASPTFGLGLVLAYPLSRWLGVDWKVTAAANVLVSNPWTTPLIWGTQFWLGLWATGKPFPDQWKALGAQGLIQNYLGAYLLGAMVFGSLLAALSYLVVTFMVRKGPAKS